MDRSRIQQRAQAGHGGRRLSRSAGLARARRRRSHADDGRDRRCTVTRAWMVDRSRPARSALRRHEHEHSAGDDRRPWVPGRVQQHDSELRDAPRAHAAAGARDLLLLRSVCGQGRRLSAGHAPVRRRSGAARHAAAGHADAVRGVPSAERRIAPRPDVRRRVRMDRAQQRLRGQRMEGRRAVECAHVDVDQARAKRARTACGCWCPTRSATSRRRSPPTIGPSPSAFPATSSRWISKPSCSCSREAGRSTGVAVEPVGALGVTAAAPAKGGQLQYVVRGKKWGRSRLTSTTQTAPRRRFITTSPSRPPTWWRTWAASSRRRPGTRTKAIRSSARRR